MKKILIIEDHIEIAELYETILGEAGYSVVLRMNGEAGVEEAKTQYFDLILLDVMLPGKNGITVLKELRANESTKKTPIYMVTALDQAIIKTQARDAGADGMMVKSNFTPQDLTDKVAEIIGLPTDDEQPQS